MSFIYKKEKNGFKFLPGGELKKSYEKEEFTNTVLSF